MDKIRIRYSKTGKAKYISHLDTMATMQRSLLRCGVRLKYSEGFNPHPYISVALPLSVGNESLCELMDVELDSPVPADLNDYLPDGLSILGFYKPLFKFNLIKWVSVECRIVYSDAIGDSELDLLKERFSAKSLIISKKTKRGMSDINIAEFISDARITRSCCKSAEICALISAQQPTVSNNDMLNIASFDEHKLKPTQINVKRIDIFDKDMVLFK